MPKFAAAVAAVVNLACISNDASFELDEDLHLDQSQRLRADGAGGQEGGVKRFVYASSSSVYGVSDKPDVTEDHPLVPLTLYNKYKGMCEPLLKKHTDASFTGVIFRPATVCGYSPRQRLDLSVNILTNHAINAGKITVFGGSQLRPNLHVQDYCDAVELFLTVSGRQDAERDLQRRLPEPVDHGDRRAGTRGGEECPTARRSRSSPRRPTTSAPTTSTRTRSSACSATAASHHRGRGPRALQAFAARKLPNSMEDDRYFNVRLLKRLKAA